MSLKSVVKAHSPLMNLVATSIILLLWQAGCEAGVINTTFMPSPLTITETLFEEIVYGELLQHLKASLIRLLTGASCGILFGLLAGLAVHLSRVARSVLSPWVSSLFAVPKIALLPLLVIWLGTGESSRLAMIALGIALPTAIYTWNSLDQVNDKWVELGQSLRLSRLQMVYHILLPAALPNILTGIRLSITIGIILLTAAEMLGSSTGIGFYLMNAGHLALVEQMMSAVVVLIIMANSCNLLLAQLSRYLLGWME
ncbi:ABC transporter permease [Endozoicomonas montiporae]|uniref:Taurine uptake ABC transporter n=1 Tax=Endozoicomonas montiporae CL-33 TaxID=570277 RepID=A0A142BGI1_9GAMM|nr:ABC transporter permease [Endozoicomonas montiporae]AMO57857.1 taurine uptake ABC transporter [Endozoicomonas montiporae CL-33]